MEFLECPGVTEWHSASMINALSSSLLSFLLCFVGPAQIRFAEPAFPLWAICEFSPATSPKPPLFTIFRSGWSTTNVDVSGFAVLADSHDPQYLPDYNMVSNEPDEPLHGTPPFSR